MKLAEFLQGLFNQVGEINTGLNNDYVLSPEILNNPLIKEQLLKCEEFKNTKEIIILNHPMPKLNIDGEEKEFETRTVKMYDGIKFKEKVYLYSIFLTPPTIDIEDLKTPIKDNICVSPIYCDPENFTPRQIFSVFVSPEIIQDNTMFENEDWKEKTVENFKKALDNPKEYLSKNKRSVMMRLLYKESIEPLKEERSQDDKRVYVKI